MKEYINTYNQVIGLLLEQVQKVTSSNGAALEIIEDTKSVYKSTVGELETLLGFQLHLPGTFTEKCVLTQQPQVCSHIKTDPSAQAARAAFVNLNIGSMIILPILDSNNKLKAVLKLTSDDEIFFNKTNVDSTYQWLFPFLKSISAAMKDADALAEKAQLQAHNDTQKIVTQLNKSLDLSDTDTGLLMFNALASLLTEGVFITNTEGVCIYTNETYQMMRDLTYDESINPDIYMRRLHSEDTFIIRNFWQEAVENHSSLTTKFKCTNRNDENLYFAVTAMPIIINGEFLGHIGLLTTTPKWD